MSKKKKKEKMDEPVVGSEAVEQENGSSTETAEDTPAPETDYKDKYLRALAEMDNLRKRLEREVAQSRKYALEDTIRQLLPSLDALDYAVEAEGGIEVIREGLAMALADLHRILKDKGVKRVDALHQPFDPRWHEAVGMLPATAEHGPGTVIHEERGGYVMHDRVLRPARVHIAVAPPPQPDVEQVDAEKEAE